MVAHNNTSTIAVWGFDGSLKAVDMPFENQLYTECELMDSAFDYVSVLGGGGDGDEALTLALFDIWTLTMLGACRPWVWKVDLNISCVTLCHHRSMAFTSTTHSSKGEWCTTNCV